MPPCWVIPELVYDDVGEAIEWLCDKLGFVERWRAGEHRAQLSFAGGTVAITEPRTSNVRPGPRDVMIRVLDVDAHHDLARARGAKIIQAPKDFAYGERQYTVEDLGGHHWTFSQSVADVAPEEWGGTTGPALSRPCADDPETLIARAVAAGASAGSAVVEHRTPWGIHRQGGFRDPFGHNWSVGDRSPLNPTRTHGEP